MTGLPVAHAFAPASVGNVAVGFDLLGLALASPGDTVTATRRESSGVVIEAIEGVAVDLPRDPAKNTAGGVAQALLAHADANFGVALTIQKGIALGSGMGGSAASAVAAAVAVNALLDVPLDHADLLTFALQGEAIASGAVHADNVAPSLLGGLVLAPADGPAYPLALPQGLVCVLARPHLELTTRAGRALLRDQYRQHEWVTQAGHLAAFVHACSVNDHDAIARHLTDTLIEPQRKAAIPGFDAIKSDVLAAGALACSISGSGPAMFAWCPQDNAQAVSSAFKHGFAAESLDCERVVSRLDAPGARLLAQSEL
ncbi:MAG: homoserine kinase [Gammaproteobacteria bacterium]